MLHGFNLSAVPSALRRRRHIVCSLAHSISGDKRTDILLILDFFFFVYISLPTVLLSLILPNMYKFISKIARMTGLIGVHILIVRQTHGNTRIIHSTFPSDDWLVSNLRSFKPCLY